MYPSLQSTKAVYHRIMDLKIATPQVIINFGVFLEEQKYFEEAFKAYERGVALFKWPHVSDIWKTYLTKFIDRYVSPSSQLCCDLAVSYTLWSSSCVLSLMVK